MDQEERERVVKRISEKKWYHSFELLPGIVTPGEADFPAGAVLDSIGWKDMRGLRALDIGTWDGALAFEMENRGAKVTALDIHDPDATGFNLAREIIGSKVKYVKSNVYRLASAVEGEFDCVAFKGVYYHLKSPIAALEQIRKVLAPDGQLYFEGECFRNYAENIDGSTPSDLDLAAFARSNVPFCLCYPASYKGGASNWFVPNAAAFKSWLKTTGLKIERCEFYEIPDAKPYPHQRIWGVATVDEGGKIAEEHVVYEQPLSLRARPGWFRRMLRRLFGGGRSL